MQSNMESAIKTVVSTFLTSAGRREDLRGKDFQNLVKKKLCNIMADTDCNAALKEMRQGLDVNEDGNISFNEYIVLIGYLATSMSESKSQSNAASS